MSSCQICTNDYGGKVVPTTLTCCGEDTICFDCLEKDRVAKISNLTGNLKKIKCMLCNKEYHSVNDTPWVVNKSIIRLTGIEVDMSGVRQAQAARQQSTHAKTSTSSPQSTRHQETEQNEGGEEEEDTTVVVNRTARQGQQQLRRSKRRKVNAEETINEDGDDNSNAATISNEEGSMADDQKNSDRGVILMRKTISN